MEINNLIKNKVENKSLLEERDIVDVINWFIDENNINLNKVVLGRVPSTELSEGGYVAENKTLYYDYDVIINNRSNKQEVLDRFLGKEYNYKNLYLNMSLIITLIHELTHAIQDQKEYSDSSLNTLIKKTMDLSKKNYDKYLKLYRYMPFEREATTNSFSVTTDLFKKNGCDQELIRYYKTCELSCILSSYLPASKFLLCPIDILLKNQIIVKNDYINLRLNPELDLYTRLKFGLPVRIEDYNKVLNYHCIFQKVDINPNDSIKELILK